MLNNAKPNELMRQCIEEADRGESIYTKSDEEEIRIIMHNSIKVGEDFNRIYDKKLKDTYPLPKGEGLFASYVRLREIYNEETKKYKKSVAVDKENMWEQLYLRYNELFWNEGDKHDIVGQKKILDSMLKLLSSATQEKVLKQAEQSDGDIVYHLDFGL